MNTNLVVDLFLSSYPLVVTRHSNRQIITYLNTHFDQSTSQLPGEIISSQDKNRNCHVEFTKRCWMINLYQ